MLCLGDYYDINMDEGVDPHFIGKVKIFYGRYNREDVRGDMGRGIRGAGDVQRHSLGFSESNGYEPKDLAKIDALEVGEVYEMSGIGLSDHSIKRLS